MDHTGLRVEMTAPIPKRNYSSGWGQLAICASALGFRFSEARPGPFGIGVAKSFPYEECVGLQGEVER